MKTIKIILLVSSIGLVLFGLNIFFDFIPFENPKNNALILMLLSIINFIFIIKKTNKEQGLK